MKPYASLGLWLMISGVCRAQGNDLQPTMQLPDLAGRRIMNGIDPKEVGPFWRDWHLVTVRFRLENSEQRFVYANEIAWQAMSTGKKTYPDGSMFGKIAYNSSNAHDAADSIGPSSFSRIQLMLKDEHKFSDSDGWSYALYFAHEDSSIEKDAETKMACVACHRLVPERDFVFSRSAFAPVSAAAPHSLTHFADKFQVRNISELPKYSRQALNYFGLSHGQVAYYAMPLFTGSQDESLGLLHAKAVASKLPYLLADNAHHRFLLVQPLPPKGDCKQHVAVSANRFLAGKGNPLPLTDFAESCDDQVHWTRSIPTPAALK